MITGKRDRKIVIEHRAETQDDTYGTPVVSWVPFATVWAEVQDMLPSRGDRVVEGVSITQRPARIRMLYRDGITSDMRIRYGSRLLKIVAGPAELGRREALEIVAEEFTPQGDAI